MKRRCALLAPWPWLTIGAATPLTATRAEAATTARSTGTETFTRTAWPVERLAAAWQRQGQAAPPTAGTPPSPSYEAGVLQIDWLASQLSILHSLPLPSRAHGLVALPDGGWVTLANRPGRWLLRCDANGMQQRLHMMVDEARTLNGHALLSPDGRWLLTSETDPRSGRGWVGQRDLLTLALVGEFESHGIDPHHLVWAADGVLMVANGGIARDSLGRKRDAQVMTPSLVQLQVRNGQLLGQWRLADPQLSIRHLAWSVGAEAGQRLLGVALQAEHESAEQRLTAPTLAVWDGGRLEVPTYDARGGGYAGDIAAGPGGGFVLSAQKQGRALWWQPALPDVMTVVAEVTEPCALISSPDGAGFSLGAGRGVARWHHQQGAQMLRWPAALAPDNHWVRLQGATARTG